MVTEIFMPKMTDFMETGVITSWLVKEGDRVEQGQPYLEVETDKATSEVEAPTSGYLKGIRLGVQPGATVPVGETIGYIVSSMDEVVPDLPPLASRKNLSTPDVADKAVTHIETVKLHDGAIKSTPVVRRVAKELGVDLALVKGSGPEGRISAQDVRNYFVLKTQSVNILQPKEVSEKAVTENNYELLSLNNIQRLTGLRMLESIQIAPQFTLTITVDMMQVLQLHDFINAQIEAATGKKLSITCILVKAVSLALREYPRANASFSDGNVKLWKQVNIGVAVGTESGLVVPVIKDADQKSLQQIALEMASFQEKAKEVRFSLEDLNGGTFTISNLGMYGIDRFNAIINPPEAAILAVGRIIKTAYVQENDKISIRPVMQLTLTIDHRCLDGIQGATFLGEVKNRLENPYLMMVI